MARLLSAEELTWLAFRIELRCYCPLFDVKKRTLQLRFVEAVLLDLTQTDLVPSVLTLSNSLRLNTAD